VSEFFTHKSICIVTVVGLFRDVFIVGEISRPREFRPANARDSCVRVTGFAGDEVAVVVEEIPFNGADCEGLAGLGVAFGEFISRISDEY